MIKMQSTRFFNPFVVLLLFLFLASSQSCGSPNNPKEDSIQKESERLDLLSINKKPLDEYTYHLEWGALKLPLEKYANPNVHKGVIEVELATFLNLLSQKIRVFKGNKALDVELINLSRPRRLTGEQLWFDYPSIEDGRLNENLVEDLRQKLKTGDQVYMRLTAKSENLQIQSAVFQIGSPQDTYYTPDLRANLQKGGEVYGFQIINEEGRQPGLRIDTTNVETQHILNLYRQNKQYKIIHIPNFKTRKRLITERESLFANKDIQQTVYLGYDFDLFTLSDYTDYIGKKVELHWGKLIANPVSENYEVAKMTGQLPAQPVLWIGNKRYPLQGFHLILSGTQQKPRRFIASEVKSRELYQALLKLQALTSVYFENIIIEEKGQYFHFPAAFSFHFGETQEFDLTIENASGVPGQSHEINSNGGKTSIIFYSTDLKAIISELFQLPEGKLRFANFDDNPLLDISFTSDKLDISAGNDLIIKRLSRIFNLNIENHIPRPTFNLKVVDEEQLNKFQTNEMEQKEDALKLEKDGEEKIAHFKNVNLETLTRFIDSELDLLIINDTQLKDKSFEVKLNYTTLAEVRASLKAMGLELIRNKEYVQVVVTKLY